jgi:hypothetical protein
MEFECELDCPYQFSFKNSSRPVFCCKDCAHGRKEFYAERPQLQQFWDDKWGFATPQGCVLPRAIMPSECKEYNCKEHCFIILRQWDGEKWATMDAKEFPYQLGKYEIGDVGFKVPTEEIQCL